MDETFQARFDELEGSLRLLSPDEQARLEPLLHETRRRHEQIRSSREAAQNALDDWRLILKYALFDSEARRREAAP